MNEKYCFTVGDEGQKSFNVLENGFNDQTKYFLNKHDLKPGFSMLDMGWGLSYKRQEGQIQKVHHLNFPL